MAVLTDLVDRVLRHWGKGPAKWPEGNIPAQADGTIEYKAYRILDDIHDREVRSSQWNIFRVRNRKLTPGVADKIAIDSDLHNVRAGTWSINCNFTVRSSNLWDVGNDTDVFTGPVYIDADEFVLLDVCPAPYQDYLVAKAAIEFGESYWTELTISERAYEIRKAELRRNEREAFARARHLDARQKRTNVLRDDGDMYFALGARRTGPSRRNP